MINHGDGYYDMSTIFRVNGSAAYKSLTAAILATVIYLSVYEWYNERWPQDEKGLSHPYVISALITAFMFLLSSKVTFSYNRYWEACTALHSMQAKWLDACQTLAAYHLQSAAYESVRPIAFGERSDISDVLFDRERSDESLVPMEERMETVKTSRRSPLSNSFGKFLTREFKLTCSKINRPDGLKSINLPSKKRNRCKTSMSLLKSSGVSPGGGLEENELLPSLFLQESAHLISLLSAVALSTLRNEIEGVDAPLCEFVPGKVWPAYNSNEDPDMKHYGYKYNWVFRNMRYIFDISRTPRERAAFNAARPFPVVGGVSEREASLLQQARGALAKVALVNMWFNEFVIREHLHGSTGNVGPPIIARIQQYQSDGTMWYNSARKLSYIPFPFPHSQITTLFVMMMMFSIPVLMLSFASFWLGLIFNFCTVSIFVGLNEVSKELEYPYRCMPNDLPLNLFQAQMNEALLVTFAGYHPDSYWDIAGDA